MSINSTNPIVQSTTEAEYEAYLEDLAHQESEYIQKYLEYEAEREEEIFERALLDYEESCALENEAYDYIQERAICAANRAIDCIAITLRSTLYDTIRTELYELGIDEQSIDAYIVAKSHYDAACLHYERMVRALHSYERATFGPADAEAIAAVDVSEAIREYDRGICEKLCARFRDKYDRGLLMTTWMPGDMFEHLCTMQYACEHAMHLQKTEHP